MIISVGDIVKYKSNNMSDNTIYEGEVKDIEYKFNKIAYLIDEEWVFAVKSSLLYDDRYR